MFLNACSNIGLALIRWVLPNPLIYLKALTGQRRIWTKPDRSLFSNAKSGKYTVQQIFIGEAASNFAQGVLSQAKFFGYEFAAKAVTQ